MKRFLPRSLQYNSDEADVTPVPKSSAGSHVTSTYVASQDTGPTGSLNMFFSQYPRFTPSQQAPIVHEFGRLCETYHWDRPKRKNVKAEFYDALTLDFNYFYGVDVNDLVAWQHLCQVVQIHPIPDDLEGCQEVSGFKLLFQLFSCSGYARPSSMSMSTLLIWLR